MTPSAGGRRPASPRRASARSGRKRRAERRRGRRRTALIALVIVPVAVIVAGAIGSTVVFGSSCDLSALRPVTAGQNTFVYAWNGSLLGAIPAARNRTPVLQSQISPWMPKATVAIEDRRYYQHGGIDPVGIMRAMVADIKAGKIVQGGSTITQELVKNLYLTRQRTIQRKLTEACLAIKLAHKWSKARILTAYMNEVYYGNHAYGIQAAAETYFSKPAEKLNLDQAALLAGLPQAPSLYDPFHDPTAALDRRDEVLRAMFTNGEITQEQYAAAVSDQNLRLRAGHAYSTIHEPYFFGYVEDVLVQEYGANTVRSGGLKVYTTINPHLQSAANVAITHVLTSSTDPASAIVAIDPYSGAIRAMTAVTPGTKGNQFNFVTSAHRQPGSTFKTIVLTAAVAKGMDPFHTYYLSAPFYYAPSHWLVQTYEHTYAGVESVESATLQSDNTVYARLALDVGPANIVAMAHKLGVRTPLKAVPSLALGSIGVTPLDMASAYATLAAGGIYSKPMAITKVVLPNGTVDRDAGWGKPKQVRVIPDWVASTVTQVLEQNMLAGTGVGANVAGHTDAGKTGTTDNYADAWFSGYTPFLESTVWIGYPKAEIPMLDVHGIAVSGPTFPATIWHLFMETAIGNRPDRKFAAARTSPKFISWHGTYEYSGAYQTYTPSSPYIAPAAPTTATTTAPAHSTPPAKPVPPAPPASNPPKPPATTAPTPP